MAKKQDTAPQFKSTTNSPLDEEQAFAEALHAQEIKNQCANGPLLPIRHPNLDFFICDILDAAPKDDLGSMEHPFFALKAGDTKVRSYEHNGAVVEVRPSSTGLPTIFDKDVWLYCIGQVTEVANRTGVVPQAITLTARDLLVATNRQVSTRGYKLLSDALDRLKGTVIKTNIATGKLRTATSFNLFDELTVTTRESSGRMVSFSLKISDWLMRAIQAREVLTISRDYFRLRKPMERRLYEMARKHCGAQPAWKCSLVLLQKKSGSVCTLREFRRQVGEVVASQHLPDYSVQLADNDTVIFTNRNRGAIEAVDLGAARLAKEADFRMAWEADHPEENWPGYQEAVRAMREASGGANSILST